MDKLAFLYALLKIKTEGATRSQFYTSNVASMLLSQCGSLWLLFSFETPGFYKMKNGFSNYDKQSCHSTFLGMQN